MNFHLYLREGWPVQATMATSPMKASCTLCGADRVSCNADHGGWSIGIKLVASATELTVSWSSAALAPLHFAAVCEGP
jgi:hypothetical protein